LADQAIGPALDRQSWESQMRFHVDESPGTVQTFSRFNPLVYFCVYGDESFYECLRLSLESLAEYGSFRGMVGVACDRSRDELITYIPETFHDRLIVSEGSRDRGWFNRYYLDHGLYDAFQPILYCDIDVVFDANIADLLIDIVLQDRVCCATENYGFSHWAELPPRLWDDRPGNYFGKYLYASDPNFDDARVPLGNSGVIGFDNTRRIRAVNGLVRRIASRQNTELLRIYSDQPILDYVLHKTGIGNFEILNKYCRLTRSVADVPPSGRCGMAHFHLASDARTKAAAMRSYLRLIAAEASQGMPKSR
jgi:hypothetical protein